MAMVVVKTAIGCSEAIEMHLGLAPSKIYLVLVAAFRESKNSQWIVRS